MLVFTFDKNRPRAKKQTPTTAQPLPVFLQKMLRISVVSPRLAEVFEMTADKVLAEADPDWTPEEGGN